MLKNNRIVNVIAILLIVYAAYLIYQAHKLSGVAESGWLLLPLYFFIPALLIGYVLYVRSRKPVSTPGNSRRLDQAITVAALLIAAIVIVFFVIPLAIVLPGLGFAMGVPLLLIVSTYAFLRFRKWRKPILISAGIIAVGLVIGFAVFLHGANQTSNGYAIDAANRAKFVLPEADAMKLIRNCKVRTITVDGDYLKIELTNDVIYFNEPGGFVKGPLASKVGLENALATSGCENAQ